MTWRGIVGKSFKTIGDFSHYVDTVQFNLWRPRFVVVHNTSAPDLKTYANWQTRAKPVTDEQWLLNLQGYYRDEQGWSAGPHLFVTPKSICAFTPLNVPGTHSPSWNSISWGVETVGEFERDPFDNGVRDNLVGALAVLHQKAGLSPLPYQVGAHGLHFHKEDVHTTHKTCPGRNMVKSDLIQRVITAMTAGNAGDHGVPPPVA